MNNFAFAQRMLHLARFLSICVSVAGLLLPAAWAAPAKNILLVGDSLSAAYGLPRDAGWAHLLTQKLKTNAPNYVLVNASISGETTSGGWQRLPGLLKQHQPAIVIIELGGNDALRGLDLAKTRQTLDQMVQASKNAHAKVMLIPMKMPSNYGPTYAKQFEDMYPKLARQRNVALAPFFLESFADKTEYFQADRIHPTALAQPLMLESVWPTIEKLLK